MFLSTCFWYKSVIGLVDEILLVCFDKITELTIAVDDFFRKIWYKEQLSLRYLDVNFLLNNAEGVLFIFFVHKVKNSNFKGFVKVSKVIAPLFILVNVHFIQLSNLGYLLTDIYDDIEELFRTIKREDSGPEIFNNYG